MSRVLASLVPLTPLSAAQPLLAVNRAARSRQTNTAIAPLVLAQVKEDLDGDELLLVPDTPHQPLKSSLISIFPQVSCVRDGGTPAPQLLQCRPAVRGGRAQPLEATCGVSATLCCPLTPDLDPHLTPNHGCASRTLEARGMHTLFWH